LALVLRQLRRTPRGAGVQLQRYSNEVWLFDDVVVRICWRGDRQRLVRETAVLRALASHVACPDVLAEGGDLGLTWMVPRRLPGHSLRAAWPELDRRSRQAAVEAIGGMLRALHETMFGDVTRQLLATRARASTRTAARS
jgi:aminoglycoside phosphotransferase